MEDQSLSITRSDTKVGEKRSCDESEENQEVGRKRVKMRDLDSVFQSEEMSSHHSKSSKSKELEECESEGEEMSQVTGVPVTLGLDASQAERIGGKKSTLVVDDAAPKPKPLDLISKVCVANSSAGDDNPGCAEASDKPSSLPGKHNREPDNRGSSIRIGLDLNAEDVASSVNQDVFYPQKNRNHLKSRDVSECVSSSGPVEVKDPMKIWKEMKQNGFLSSSHGGVQVQNSTLSSSLGGIPPVPKQRGRKTKSDSYKKKMEIAKKENVDRFTKIAAPSGLLNELNPGIINNVRNKKQVYSIIEAIVKSEKNENQHSGFRNLNDTENLEDSGISRHSDSYKEDKNADGDSSMVDQEDDALALKLSSSTKAFENASSLSNEESTNFTDASSLSVKAASVASQWLELLHQDIKGRLSALRRSKKRVRAVITTELPFLISKEFSLGQDNDLNVMRNSFDGVSKNATGHMHQQRWNALFDQLDRALSEEEKQLENWLNQVREMQLHCDQGLQYVHWNSSSAFQHPGTSENDFRSARVDSSERELAVRASAASIYSTCNFFESKENVSCF
ncbi:hypothetical protein LWI29_019317 [Acer saccharum]|uniref:Uncharacterized protein n=1 Tax=Acer saccharum TaxID=4024 RepID=A0AA39SE38_ACESA|nr:hypothetical protein LWI29_019317 [Acer saccharum]